MKNLSISKKLIVGFGIVLALMIMSIVLSIVSISSVGTQTEKYGSMTVPNVSSTWEMRRDLVSAQRYMLRAFVATDRQAIQKELDKSAADAQNILVNLEKYAANQPDSSQNEKVSEFKTVLANAATAREDIVGKLLLGTDQALADAEKNLTRCMYRISTRRRQSLSSCPTRRRCGPISRARRPRALKRRPG